MLGPPVMPASHLASHLAIGGARDARGLAVLFGWSGSSLRNVQKYAAVWHKLGWRTATAAMSIDMTFFPGSWTPANEIASALAEECRDHRERIGSDALVASHAFSNGGAMLMLSVLEEAAEKFDGAIYDSAPSYNGRLLEAGAPVIIMSSGLPKAEQAKKLLVHTPYCLAACLLHQFRQAPAPIGLFPKLFGAETNPPRPELFIYGDKDFLIPPAQVEKFIGLRESQGCAVRSLPRLAGSPHVGHLRSYPKEYEDAVGDFARELEKG